MNTSEHLAKLAEQVSQATGLNFPTFDFPHYYDFAIIGGAFRVELNIPYSLDYLRQARRALGKGWKSDGAGIKELGSTGRWLSYIHTRTGIKELGSTGRWLSYIHTRTGTRLDIDLDATAEGATCKRQLVGKQEVNVYEIVCA